METSTVDITQIIMNTINTLFSNIFASIDNTLYAILDDITFLNEDILQTSYFKNIFGTSTTNGILLIANSLILGFVLYYAIQLLLSNLGITQVTRPSSFLFKLLFFTICMNCSFFLCEHILFLNSTISSAIRELGENLFGKTICFSALIDKLNTIIHIEENSLNIFSMDGLLKSIISVSFLNLTFSYAIRYILVRLFILISPFAFLSLSLPTSSGFFKSWLKCLLSLLFVQHFVSFVLLLIFSLDFNPNNIFSKILICGAIFVLIRANSYIKEFMGGVSTDVSSSVANIRSLLKN